MTTAFYPIGTPGQAWGAAEKAQWLARQRVQRSYADDVLARIDALRDRFDVAGYGELDYPSGRYPLLAIRSRGWGSRPRCKPMPRRRWMYPTGWSAISPSS